MYIDIHTYAHTHIHVYMYIHTTKLQGPSGKSTKSASPRTEEIRLEIFGSPDHPVLLDSLLSASQLRGW